MRKSLLLLAALLALGVVGFLLLAGEGWFRPSGDGVTAKESAAEDSALRRVAAPFLQGRVPGGRALGAGTDESEPYTSPKGALTGRVLDPSGRPLAGADIYLHRSATAGRAHAEEHDLFTFLVAARDVSATTGPEGRFAIQGAGDGPAWLVAHGEGYGMRAEVVRLRGGQAVGGGIEIMLDPGRRFEGRVVNQHGAGVAGVSVALVGSAWQAFLGHIRGVAVTGADGCYTAWAGTGSDGGTLVAYARADIATLVGLGNNGGGDLSWPAFVDVTVRFVCGENRAPLEGLSFWTGSWDGDTGPTCMVWSVTDVDGKARVALSPGVLGSAAGTHPATGSFAFDSDDVVKASTHAGVIPAGREASVEILVGARSAATVVGTVRDEQGRPIRGALVVHGGREIRRATHGRGDRVVQVINPVKARTDGDGSFAFRLSAVRSASAVTLQVRAPGFAPLDMLIPAVAGSRLRLPRRVAVTLRRGARLVGRVFDAQGRPLAGAWVRADVQGADAHVTRGQQIEDGVGAVTGADGRYTLRGLPFDADVELTAEHRSGVAAGSAKLHTDRRVSQTAPTIRLAAGRSVRVRVLGPGGLVHAGAFVTIFPIADAFGSALDFQPQQQREHRVATGEDGEAAYRQLAAGPYTLLITAEGTAGVAAPLVIGLGGGSQEVTVRLRRSARLRGRVIDHKGRPVTDLKLVVLHPDETVVTQPSQWIPYAHPTNHDRRNGHFEIHTVPPGVPVRLHVDSSYYQPAAVTTRGGGPPLEIVLQPWDAALLEQIEAVAAKENALVTRLGRNLEAALARDPALAATVEALKAEAERLLQKHREVSGALSCGGGGRG